MKSEETGELGHRGRANETEIKERSDTFIGGVMEGEHHLLVRLPGVVLSSFSGKFYENYNVKMAELLARNQDCDIII